MDYNYNVRFVTEAPVNVILEVQIEIDNTSIDLPQLPDNAHIAWLQIQSGRIRFTMDGSEPDTDTGFILDSNIEPNQFWKISSRQVLEDLKMVKDRGRPVVRIAYGRLPDESDIRDD